MYFEMFVASIVVGIMTGWLAGIVMKGGGYGLHWDLNFGLGGSVVGSLIFQTLGAPEAGWAGTGIARLSGQPSSSRSSARFGQRRSQTPR